MASTITIKSDDYKGRYMQLVCEQTKDEANNKSVIKWTLSSIGGEVNYYSTGPTSVYINATCVYYKDRVNYTSEVFPAAKGSVSGTIEVDHNEDGTKGTSVLLNTVVYYGSGSIKGYSSWWELDPIQRYARLTNAPSSFDNTSPPAVEYTYPSGNNVSKVEVCIADSAGYYALAPYGVVDKAKTSYTFTADDLKLLNNNVPSNGTELAVMFVIRTTYTDGNTDAEGKTSTYKMLEVADTKPTVTMTVTPSNPPSVPSALANTYIQGKSGVNATITAEGRYKATISKAEVTADTVGAGCFFTPPTAKDTVTLTTGAITKSGNVEVVGSAKDTREFTGEAKQTINVTEYSRPLVIPIGSENAILCYRSDGNGKRVGNSSSVWIKAKRSYYNLGGKNGCSLQWRRKRSAEVWNDNDHKWADLIPKTTTNTDEYDALVSGEFILNESYAVQIKAVDDLGEHDIKEFEIPTQDVALHLGKGGKNVTIGEYCDYSEEYTFRSAWKAIFDNGIYGTMTQQSVSDMLAFAEGCPQGFTPFFTGGSTTNVPATGNYQYASGFVCKRSDSQITVVIFSYYSGDLAINTYYDTAGGWLGWRYLHTTTT
jgi:hypothetical protein